MYSVVMMVAMTSGGESVDCLFRRHCHGCSSSCSVAVAPACTGTVVYSAPVSDCCHSSHGCNGGGLFSRLFHHKNDCCSAPVNDCCHGASDCCNGRGGFLRRLFHHKDNNCCCTPAVNCCAPVAAAPVCCGGTVVVPVQTMPGAPVTPAPVNPTPTK